MHTKSLVLIATFLGLVAGAPASVKPSHSGAPLQPASGFPPRPTGSAFPHSGTPPTHPGGPRPTGFPHSFAGISPHSFAEGGHPHSFSGVRPSFTGVPPRPTGSPHPHSLGARDGSDLPHQPAHILSGSPVPHPHPFSGKPPKPTGSKPPHEGGPRPTGSHPPHSLKARQESSVSDHHHHHHPTGTPHFTGSHPAPTGGVHPFEFGHGRPRPSGAHPSFTGVRPSFTGAPHAHGASFTHTHPVPTHST
ncbi:hypothetical protein FRC07_010491 [Ceratobasidium sp. 392]|nr:hypothetical protein FRC07_010491 [Ceratobasidium sp. 392]